MDYQLGPGPLQVDQNTIDEKIKGDIGIVENGDVAIHAIPSGYYVIWKGNLYVAKTDISSGTTLSTSNLTAKPNGIGADVAQLNSKIATYPTFKAFQIAANSSITLNISGSGRCVITAFSGGNARNMYICRASGNALGIDELGNSSLISTSISGANLTLTSTIGSTIYLYVTIYYGDVTAI